MEAIDKTLDQFIKYQEERFQLEPGSYFSWVDAQEEKEKKEKMNKTVGQLPESHLADEGDADVLLEE